MVEAWQRRYVKTCDVFPLWYAVRARVRATIVTLTFWRRKKNEKSWRTCRLHPYVERSTGGRGVDFTAQSTRYLRGTRRNSATRLSDPHDLTHTEDATTRRPGLFHASQVPRKKRDCKIACVIGKGKGNGKSRKTVDVHVNRVTLSFVSETPKNLFTKFYYLYERFCFLRGYTVCSHIPLSLLSGLFSFSLYIVF